MSLTESDFETLEKGSLIPSFSLRETNEEMFNINSVDKPVLIVFMCNHCPYVLAKLDALNDIYETFKGKIEVIGINSNDQEMYEDDSFENMKTFVSSGKIKFTYLEDPTQEIAKIFGATCTPDPFLFDSDKKLVYHGRIDDGHGPNANISTYDLKNAIAELLNAGRVTVEEFPSMGCNIKWK